MQSIFQISHYSDSTSPCLAFIMPGHDSLFCFVHGWHPRIDIPLSSMSRETLPNQSNPVAFPKHSLQSVAIMNPSFIFCRFSLIRFRNNFLFLGCQLTTLTTFFRIGPFQHFPLSCSHSSRGGFVALIFEVHHVWLCKLKQSLCFHSESRNIFGRSHPGRGYPNLSLSAFIVSASSDASSTFSNRNDSIP